MGNFMEIAVFVGDLMLSRYFKVGQVQAALAVAAGGDGGVPLLGGPSKVESVQVHSGIDTGPIFDFWLLLVMHYFCMRNKLFLELAVNIDSRLPYNSLNTRKISNQLSKSFSVTTNPRIQSGSRFEPQIQNRTSAKSGINSRTTSEELSKSHVQYRHELLSVTEPNQESTDNISIESNHHEVNFIPETRIKTLIAVEVAVAIQSKHLNLIKTESEVNV